MAKYKIDVRYPYPTERMLKNKDRIESVINLKNTDRVPVLFGVFERFVLEKRGISYSEFFSSPETMLYHQIMNQKWLIENVPDDRFQEKVLRVSPCWENILIPASFGCEIVWMDNQAPYAKSIINSPDDALDFEMPDYMSGLWGKNIKYFLEWQDLKKDYDIYFNGQPGRIEILPLEFGGFGPFLTAVKIVGEDFFMWLHLYPEIVHELLKKITETLINAELKCREIDKRKRYQFVIAEDTAEMISIDMFKEFCVPYDLEMYRILGYESLLGRGLHNCGNCEHLLESFIKDLKINYFALFGNPVDPYKVAKIMGGKAYIWGNLDPIVLLSGKEEEIINETISCLTAFKEYNGYCLSDGANIAPGTPIKNLEKVVSIVEKFKCKYNGLN